jgi:hypothetical protein
MIMSQIKPSKMTVKTTSKDFRLKKKTAPGQFSILKMEQGGTPSGLQWA